MTSYRQLESDTQAHLAARTPDELARDATLTHLTARRIGSSPVAAGWTITTWRRGYDYYCRASCPGWTLTAAAHTLAIAEDHLLIQLTSALPPIDVPAGWAFAEA
jgi:hypothetical protein